MPRIICIDYGGKRCGLAVTDPLQIIATALLTVETKNLYTFLADYFKKEEVELILIGEPLNLDNTPTHATPLVKKAIVELEKKAILEAVEEQEVQERILLGPVARPGQPKG